MAHQQKFKADIQTTRPENDLELIQRIGSGTYGEVYKANVKKTGALAAVKIINIEPGDDFDVIQQEIMIMQDCKHSNIVQYFGSYLRRDKLWIAMEFCGGGSLQDIYSITGALTEPMIGFTCTEMLKGLHYMHQQKKLHRDIKGANILLTNHGDVKLADFGVGAQITSTVGKRKSFIGTPYWMAPEVAAVERTGGYDHLCDIWAVGITAIELAECQPPLFELHPMRALYLISKRNYTPPSLKSKKWSNHFKDFLKQSLTKNPKKRPDADRLLNHAFSTENKDKRNTLCELLDNHDKLKEKKKNKMMSNYSSDEEPDKEKQDQKKEENGTEEKKVTVKRIQSKKEKKTKEKPEVPKKENKPALQSDSSEEFTRAGGIRKESDEKSNEVADASTIKSPPKRNLPPPPPPNAPLPPQPTVAPPQPPQRPPPPPSVDHRYVCAPNDAPPPLPPRGDCDTLKPQVDALSLDDVSADNPPPLPPRSPVASKRLHNERPQSQLFTQKADKNCFTKIFNECPLNMLHAASWKHPETKSNYLLFASKEGIYSLKLEDTGDIEMVQIFSRACKWVYVVKNMLISICGTTTTSVYMHNLLSLHTPKDDADNIVVLSPKAVAYTVKIPGTGNTLKCCVAHNPYNNEVYLYAGRKDGILILQWYEPLQKFMIVRDVPCTLPPELPIFEPIVRKGAEHTCICVGVYEMANGDFLLDNIDVESGTDWELKSEYKRADIKSLSQLEQNIILIAYDKTVQFIEMEGKPLLYSNSSSKLRFDNDIEDAICLPGSVLTFSKHGVQGKGFQHEQITAEFEDHTRLYKLLCSDRIVVLESYVTAENHSNLYILASDQS